MESKSIAIIGLGLMGGSIAKSVKKHLSGTRVLGYNRSKASLLAAYKDGMIANSENPSFDEIGKCDYIFLCLPVQVNVSFAKDLIPHLSDKTVLTDIGSVKNDICKEMTKLGLSSRFIPGHPMAGSEKSGYAASNDTLLEGARYILTPDDTVDTKLFEDFKSFIEALGSLVITMNPVAHDQAVAAISHLPHVLSFSYASAIADLHKENAVLSEITAGSYRDMTRIALSDPVMWREIFVTNKDEILDVMDVFTEEIHKLRRLIRHGDFDAIDEYIKNAADYQNEYFKKNKK